MSGDSLNKLTVTETEEVSDRPPDSGEGATMSAKNSTNGYLERPKHLLQQRSEQPFLRLQSVELERSVRYTKETQGNPRLEVRRAASIREMLESDNYEVALLARGELDHVRGSAGQSGSAAPRALVLPRSWKQLIGRVFDTLRESYTHAESRVTRFGDVCVDFAKREVSRLSGEPIRLLNQEFKTLQCFLSHPERVLSRDELLNEAWGYENYPTTRTVDNHVLRLRQKLETDPARPIHFQTIHGVGYRFVP
jgi:DNA-binding winged helix-turn-helix (wHTH) protein